ncbi:hypothetical protein ACVIM8_001800 [Bradyrhizobium sp. USDA 4529]
MGLSLPYVAEIRADLMAWMRFTATVMPGETLQTADGAFRVRVVERDVVVIGSGFARTG